MNERIEKLALECYHAPEFDYKKLVELIVRECALQCNHNDDMDRILEHFGVEE